VPVVIYDEANKRKVEIMSRELTRVTFLEALRVMSPIITGFIPTAMAYAILVTANGIDGIYAILSSILVFAGSVQFLSVELIKDNMGILQFALLVFLLNSRHMFYGISVFDKFNETGKLKPVMIFWLIDETYAVLTGTKTPANVNRKLYFFMVAMLAYLAWNLGTAIGVFASSLVTFDATGIEFAMCAMFIVIMIEQMKAFKSMLPFLIGGLTALVSLMLLGGQTMMLGCAAGSVLILLLLRGKLENECS
jgi:4-azaleucine resistance transporter AzlC